MINRVLKPLPNHLELREMRHAPEKDTKGRLMRPQPNSRAMRVLFVTAEAEPLAKSGGLADVSRALPIALRQQGVDVRVLLPGYPSAVEQLVNPHVEANLEPLLGVESVTLVSGYLPNSDVPVWLVIAPSLFTRAGGLYQADDGQDWADNALRFALFACVATEIATGRVLDWKPDVVHSHDWHAGLVPLLLGMQNGLKPATVFTIHNLAFQGNFPQRVLPTVGIPEHLFNGDGIEFYGQISYLKAALQYSDKITTVSPTYANEILTPEFGCGFDGVLNARKEDFCGILNGIDNISWDPATDVHIAQGYSRNDISGKRVCKREFQRTWGLEINACRPLIGFVSRLAHQKMADVVLEVVSEIVAAGGQFILLGEGDPALEVAFQRLQYDYPQRVAIHIGYDQALAHGLQAGADILLAPARFEPCGLTQLYALRYGTVPVVRRTGGLADTVKDIESSDQGTGFTFETADRYALMDTIQRALALYKEPLAWRRLQLKGMIGDFGWDASAARYVTLYHEVSRLQHPAPTVSWPTDEKGWHIAGESRKALYAGRV